MTALRTIVLSVAILTAAAPTTIAKPADSDPTPSEQMIEQINAVRAKHDLRPLRAAPRLERSSRGYARRLIRVGSFVHGTSYARTGFRRSGEILAMQQGSDRKPGFFVRMWMRSPSHRAMILDRSFRYFGANSARGNFNGTPTTIWVGHFGAH